MRTRGIAGNKGARRAGMVWGVIFLAAVACGPAFPATLEWGTYLGGSNDDYARGVALDGDGNLYVVGDTASTGWVSGGWDTTFNNGLSTEKDAFLVKLSPAGAHVWSTYLGGSGEEFGYGVALDGSGNILIAGKTKSSGWVSGGWSTFLDPAYTDGFLVKVSSAGAHVWSTYLGGGIMTARGPSQWMRTGICWWRGTRLASLGCPAAGMCRRHRGGTASW